MKIFEPVKPVFPDASLSALVNVGCCYMKLNDGLDKQARQDWSTDDETSRSRLPDHNSSNNGFPLSNLDGCKQTTPLTLSYAARELACHSIDAFAGRLAREADSGELT